MTWRYFENTDETGDDYELYRCPNNGKRLREQDTKDVQICLQSGEWLPGQKARIIHAMMSGGFVERDNELTEEQALAFIEKWQKTEWPGPKF